MGKEGISGKKLYLNVNNLGGEAGTIGDFVSQNSVGQTRLMTMRCRR